MGLSTYGICQKTNREHAQKVPGYYPEQRRLNGLLGEWAPVLYAHCCARKEKWDFFQNFPSKRVPFFVEQNVFLSGQCFSKYLENKCNLLNDTFHNFKYGVCLAPPLHGVEKNTIPDYDSTTDSVKSMRSSGDIPTWRAWFHVLPHKSGVVAASSQFLGSLL